MRVRVASHSDLLSHRRSIPAAARNAEDTVQAMLQNVCDVGIVVCVLAVPLMMAGIREYGVALFVLCSFVVGIAWATQQLLYPASHSPIGAAATIAGLAIGLVWLQIQSLPDHLLASLSPFNSRYLQLWGSPQGRMLEPSGWHQISMTPEATRSGLVLLIAYAIFFLTLVQRVRTNQDIDRLIKLVGISTTVMAIIGIAQVIIGDDRFLWLIKHPTRSASWPAKGTFTNQNHFAHFLALGIGPVLYWWQSTEQKDGIHDPWISSRSGGRPRILIGGCAAVLALGAICSISRGGIAVFLIATAVAICAAGLSWRAVLRLVIPVTLFLVASLLAFGTEGLHDRWNEISQARSVADLSHGRWVLWTALSHAVSEFWPSGSGVGSHADIYPIWMSEQFDVRFSHAECGYLQILLETGVPGFGLLVSGIGLCGWWCLRSWRRGTKQQKRRVTALAAGLVASILHSLVDFVWYIPGCMILTLVIIACVCRCSHLTGPVTSADRPPVTRFATLFACTLLVAILPVGRLFANTMQRDLASLPHWQSFHSGMREIAKDPGTDKVDLLNDRLDFLIGELEQCTKKNIFHHDAYTALAPLYLQRFEKRSNASDNQMTIQDIRDTIRQAGFETRHQMHDWLVRAFGDNAKDLYRAIRTARRALGDRPLRSESYIVLSETAFLAGLSQAEVEALIAQAVRLRPHSPRVLYAAGLLAADSGDTESAWQLWRHAAALNRVTARQIIARFIDRLPVEELIGRLSPGRTMCLTLYDVYAQAERPEEQKAVAIDFADNHREALFNDEASTADDWRSYARLFTAANHDYDAIMCLKRAVEQQPANLASRRLLAEALAGQGRFEEARQELSWLRVRLPDDRRIADLLTQMESELTTENSSRNQDSPESVPSQLPH